VAPSLVITGLALQPDQPPPLRSTIVSKRLRPIQSIRMRCKGVAHNRRRVKAQFFGICQNQNNTGTERG
jgi:hypothetical protein